MENKTFLKTNITFMHMHKILRLLWNQPASYSISIQHLIYGMVILKKHKFAFLYSCVDGNFCDKNIGLTAPTPLRWISFGFTSQFSRENVTPVAIRIINTLFIIQLWSCLNRNNQIVTLNKTNLVVEKCLLVKRIYEFHWSIVGHGLLGHTGGIIAFIICIFFFRHSPKRNFRNWDRFISEINFISTAFLGIHVSTFNNGAFFFDFTGCCNRKKTDRHFPYCRSFIINV